MSNYAPLPIDDDRPILSGPLVGTLMVAAAAIVYLLTRHPLLAAILPWLHGGWPTFSTGLWILRTDPLRSRGRVCFLFYLASACWKAAAMSLATIAVLGWAGGICGIRVNESEIIATSIAFVSGLLLTSFVAMLAVAAALACKVRACVRTNLRTLLQNDLSRAAQVTGPVPRSILCSEFIVVATAAILPLAVLSTLILALMFAGNAPQAQPNGFLLTLGMIVLFGIPASSIPLTCWLCSRVIAKSPRECWWPISTTR